MRVDVIDVVLGYKIAIGIELGIGRGKIEGREYTFV